MLWAGLVLWLHLLAAMFWVGGQIFLVLVLLPVLRGSLTDRERTAVAARAGRRFLNLSTWALGILLLTGPLNVIAHGSSWASLRDSTWGHVLAAKVALVLVVVAITGLHAGYYGRRLEELAATDDAAAPRRRRLQRQSVLLSALNLLLNLAIVGLSAWLATLP